MLRNKVACAPPLFRASQGGGAVDAAMGVAIDFMIDYKSS